MCLYAIIMREKEEKDIKKRGIKRERYYSVKLIKCHIIRRLILHVMFHYALF